MYLSLILSRPLLTTHSNVQFQRYNQMIVTSITGLESGYKRNRLDHNGAVTNGGTVACELGENAEA